MCVNEKEKKMKYRLGLKTDSGQTHCMAINSLSGFGIKCYDLMHKASNLDREKKKGVPEIGNAFKITWLLL